MVIVTVIVIIEKPKYFMDSWNVSKRALSHEGIFCNPKKVHVFYLKILNN